MQAQISTMADDQLYRLVDDYLEPRQTSIASLFQQRQLEMKTTDNHRNVSIFIAGTGRDPAMDRMAEFLVDGYQLPLTIVSFDVFGLQDGTRLLAREVAEIEETTRERQPSTNLTLEQVCQIADQNGVGPLFRKFPPLAEELGFSPRPYKLSIMYTPQAMRNRMLFTVWAMPDKGLLSAYVGTEPFSEFFGVPLDVVEQYLGKEGWRRMNEVDVDRFISGLRNLFSAIRQSV